MATAKDENKNAGPKTDQVDDTKPNDTTTDGTKPGGDEQEREGLSGPMVPLSGPANNVTPAGEGVDLSVDYQPDYDDKNSMKPTV